MKKKIKKYGGTAVITLNTEDLDIYELKIGDVVEIHLIKQKLQRER
ncbi:MAG: hypothetical protein KKF54_04655 [Candidatus Omnitrophica bacterium]|nr:hypothetical protein [Candidatus Omnitrophota bacterium]